MQTAESAEIASQSQANLDRTGAQVLIVKKKIPLTNCMNIILTIRNKARKMADAVGAKK